MDALLAYLKSTPIPFAQINKTNKNYHDSRPMNQDRTESSRM